MSLFSNIDEVKNYLPVAITFDFRDILPYIKRAESKFIIPTLSKTQFDDLDEAYQASIAVSPTSLSPENIALLDKVRTPLANLAYMLFIPMGQVLVDSGGIHITSTENTKTAFQWQIRDLEKSFRDAGYEGIDTMLDFLDTNKSTYTLWASSTCFTDFKQFFINTAAQFSDIVNISSSRRTFLAMKGIIRKVEDFFIKPVIGKALFDNIKSEILSESVSVDNQALLDMIIPAVAHLTASKAVASLPIEITDKGISVNSVMNTQNIGTVEPAASSALSLLKSESQSDGENYLKQLRDYLYTNVDTYTLFKSSTAYIAGSTDVFSNDSNAKIGLF